MPIYLGVYFRRETSMVTKKTSSTTKAETATVKAEKKETAAAKAIETRKTQQRNLKQRQQCCRYTRSSGRRSKRDSEEGS